MRPSSDSETLNIFTTCSRLRIFALAVLCGGTIGVAGEGEPALQLDFTKPAGLPQLPMEIMNGTTPATAETIQRSTRDSTSDVRIPEESKGKPIPEGKSTAKATSPANEKSVEIWKGTTSGTAAVDEKTVDVATEEFDQEKPEKLADRTVTHLDRLTDQLVSQSRNAWLRGLVDQASYAAWLDVASTTQLRVATQQGDDRRTLQILGEQVALWTEAAAQLEAFNQPAAQGWQADLAHSEVMVLRAKLRYSVATGNPLHSNDQWAYQQLAARHLDARLQDFQTGTGTAASVLAAARMVDERLVLPKAEDTSGNQSSAIKLGSFQVDQPVALRGALQEILRPVHLETYPRAIAIRDLAEDRSAISLAATYSDCICTPEADRNSERFLTQLDRHAGHVAARQFARFQTGTATPGGMLREWWLQESMTGSLTADLRDSEFATAQTRRLEGIHQFATSISDLRGRNSADVAAAEVLLAVQRYKVEPLAGRRKAVDKDERPTESVALVVEYGKTEKATE